MIVTIGGIPVYDALILDEDSGMMKISLVDDPAVMSNFQSFDAKKKMLMYEVTNEEKRLVRGVVMRADFPIYRRDEKMGEYYIIYKADTIRQMAEKYLNEGRQNILNAMHQGEDLNDINMVQYFIKGDGVSVEGFEECADGSLFAEFHINNDEVWEKVKDGTYRGFSLEGIFDLSPEQDKNEVQEIVDGLDGKFNSHNKKDTFMSKFSRLKAALVKALAAFGNITTDKGILAWDGDDDLKAGDSVYLEDAEGERTPAEDGNYKTEDNKTIVVVDGKVSEILNPEAEVAPSTDVEGASVDTDKGTLIYEGETLEVGSAVYMVNPDDPEGDAVPAEDGEYKTEDGKVIVVVDGKVESITEVEAETDEEMEGEDDVDALKAENDALKAENDALKAEIAKLQEEIAKASAEMAKLKKKPAAKPAHEEVETSVKMQKTGNKRLDNLARVISAK